MRTTAGIDQMPKAFMSAKDSNWERTACQLFGDGWFILPFNDSYSYRPSTDPDQWMVLRNCPHAMFPRHFSGKVIAQSAMTGGYKRWDIYKPCGRRQVIKRCNLVATHHHGLRPTVNHVARHLDGNPLNDVADNLAWGTKKENAADRELHGTCDSRRGENSNFTNLSESLARLIIELPHSHDYIAKTYGVNIAVVKNIRAGRSWVGLRHLARPAYPTSI